MCGEVRHVLKRARPVRPEGQGAGVARLLTGDAGTAVQSAVWGAVRVCVCALLRG